MSRFITLLVFLLPCWGFTQICNLKGSVDVYVSGTDERIKAYRPILEADQLVFHTEYIKSGSEEIAIERRDIGIIWDNFDGFIILFDQEGNLHCSQSTTVFERPFNENLIVWSKSGEIRKYEVPIIVGQHPLLSVGEKDHWPIDMEKNDILMSVFYQFGSPRLNLHVSSLELIQLKHLVIKSLQENSLDVLSQKDDLVVVDTGRMEFETFPAGAGVWLNDKLVGETPFSKVVELGEYRVILQKPAYDAVKFSISLRKDEVVHREFQLTAQNLSEPLALNSTNQTHKARDFLAVISLVGAGTGGYFLYRHVNTYNRYQTATLAAEGLRESAQFAGTVYPIAFGVSAASLIGAILLNSKQQKKKRVKDTSWTLVSESGGVGLTFNF